MDLLYCQLLAAHAVASHGYRHAGLSPQRFGLCGQGGSRPVYYDLCLGAHASVVDGRGEDKSLCLPDEWVELIHVVLNDAFLVLEAVVAVFAGAEAFAPHSE